MGRSVTVTCLVSLLLMSLGGMGVAHWLAEKYDPEGLGSVSNETRRRL